MIYFYLRFFIANAEVAESDLSRHFNVDSGFIHAVLDVLFCFLVLFFDLSEDVIRQRLKIFFAI